MTHYIILLYEPNAKKLGLELLRDDLKHLSSIMSHIPYDQRKYALKTYASIWTEAMAKCENPIAAQNSGRSTANQYLNSLLKDQRNVE